MSRRYSTRRIVVNDLEMYKEMLKKRNVKKIFQYDTPVLNHPDSDQIDGLNLEAHRWTVGDRFFKLADKYYNDPRLWWVIAQFNKTPTESHVELGDLIYIPLPLGEIMRMYGL